MSHKSILLICVVLLANLASAQKQFAVPQAPYDEGTDPLQPVGGQGGAPYEPTYGFGRYFALAEQVGSVTSSLEISLPETARAERFASPKPLAKALDLLNNLGKFPELAGHPDLHQSLQGLKSAYLAYGNTPTPLLQTQAEAAGKDYLGSFQSNFVVLSNAYRDEVAEDARIASLRIGFYAQPGRTEEYSTLVYTPGEDLYNSEGTFTSAYYLTGTEIAPLNSGSSNVTGRLGFGLVFGDPKQVTATVSVANYFSPEVFDAQVGLSYCLNSSNAKLPPGSSSHPLAQDRDINRESHLIDHVRGGDLWAAASLRYLSGVDSIGPASVYEGALTYGFGGATLKSSSNPLLCTTLTLSGTYCSDHSLWLDEFAAELRYPIDFQAGVLGPAFLAARYGTRNDLMFSLEVEF